MKKSSYLITSLIFYALALLSISQLFRWGATFSRILWVLLELGIGSIYIFYYIKSKGKVLYKPSRKMIIYNIIALVIILVLAYGLSKSLPNLLNSEYEKSVVSSTYTSDNLITVISPSEEVRTSYSIYTNANDVRVGAYEPMIYDQEYGENYITGFDEEGFIYGVSNTFFLTRNNDPDFKIDPINPEIRYSEEIIIYNKNYGM